MNISNKPQKRILVLMSTYNGERYLREQMDSILRQKTSYEIHLRIRDDGSKDRTCEIIDNYIRENYTQKNTANIELIRGINIGYNASFFNLIQRAEGFDYYSISDQDDVWSEEKLQTACDAIDSIKDDIPILYASTSYLVHNDLIPYGTTRKKEREMTMYNTIIQNICPGHTQVMNNRLLELLKDDIDTTRIYVYDSWIQNIANLYGRILFDNNPHTYYRQYDGNQMGSGVGKTGQLMVSFNRIENGEGDKYRTQIEYFMKKNKVRLSEIGYYHEIEKFINAETLLERFMYCIFGKLYRQSRLETIAYKTAVLLGKY